MDTLQAPARLSGKTILLATAMFSLALVISSVVVFQGYVESKQPPGLISLSGTAERIIKSDDAKWSVSFSTSVSGSTSTQEARTALEAKGDALRDFLKKNGIDDADLSFQPVQAYLGGGNEYYGDYMGSESVNNAPKAYAYAARTVVIESKHVDEIGNLAAHSTYTIDAGTTVVTNRVEFFYGELNALKKTLEGEAFRDAQDKARALVGGQLGRLQSIDAPYYSVSPNKSSQNNYNESDTSSIEKKVTATMKVSFRL